MITLLFFLGMFAAGSFLSITKRPIYGLCVHLMCLYFHAPGSWWGSSLPDLRWSFLSAFITLLSVMIHHKKQECVSKTHWLSSPVAKLLLAYVIWVWIQNAWATSFALNYQHSILMSKFLLLIYLIRKCLVNKEDYLSLLVCHIVGNSFWGYIGLSHTSGRFETVPSPGMSDGNLLAIHMGPFILLASFVLLMKLNKYKFALVPFIVVTLNGVFLTQSRGGLVGLVIAGVVAVLFVPKYAKKTFYLYAVVALVGAASILGQTFIERIQNTVGDQETGEVEASAESRIFIAQAQWKIAKQNIIFGHGNQGTLMLARYYLDDKWLTGKGGARARGSHNLTMSILVDGGLVGIFLYYGIFVYILSQFFSQRKNIVSELDGVYMLFLGTGLGVICFLATSQFANSVKLETDIWLIGMASVLIQWIKERKPDTLNSKRKTKYKRRTA